MKNLLKRILFASLLLSAAISSRTQAGEKIAAIRKVAEVAIAMKAFQVAGEAVDKGGDAILKSPIMKILKSPETGEAIARVIGEAIGVGRPIGVAALVGTAIAVLGAVVAVITGGAVVGAAVAVDKMVAAVAGTVVADNVVAAIAGIVVVEKVIREAKKIVS